MQLNHFLLLIPREKEIFMVDYTTSKSTKLFSAAATHCRIALTISPSHINDAFGIQIQMSF